MAEAARHGARILPVDSEHSAIFQALVGEDIGSVERIILTASGGALRDWPLERSLTVFVMPSASMRTRPSWPSACRPSPVKRYRKVAMPTRSPTWSVTGSRIRRPLTKLPLMLPRSLSCHCPPVIVSRACWRETSGESMVKVQS